MSIIGQAINDLSNLRDVLAAYNRITHDCFQRCAANFNYHDLTEKETACVDVCSAKHILGNQRMMSSFMQIQTVKQKKMMEDAEKQIKEQEATQAAQLEAQDPSHDLTQAPLTQPATPGATTAPLTQPTDLSTQSPQIESDDSHR